MRRSTRAHDLLLRCYAHTPDDLVREGLYKKIAVPLQPDSHHAISLALLAMELGGTVKKSFAVKSVEAAEHKVSSMRFTLRRSTSRSSVNRVSDTRT